MGEGEAEAEARTSGGEPDITLRCVLGGADWALRAHRLDQQHREDGQLAPKIVREEGCAGSQGGGGLC